MHSNILLMLKGIFITIPLPKSVGYSYGELCRGLAPSIPTMTARGRWPRLTAQFYGALRYRDTMVSALYSILSCLHRFTEREVLGTRAMLITTFGMAREHTHLSAISSEIHACQVVPIDSLPLAPHLTIPNKVK